MKNISQFDAEYEYVETEEKTSRSPEISFSKMVKSNHLSIQQEEEANYSENELEEDGLCSPKHKTFHQRGLKQHLKSENYVADMLAGYSK